MTSFSGTGAQILVHCLSLNGVRRLSCVAGESYLAVLDALLDHPDISVVTCRQEGGAAFMAESWGKLKPRSPGVCFVTRGPGACNASIGVHTAMQDSTPLILFVGLQARADKGREAFQEIDIREVFGGLAKWTVEINDAARIPEIVNRAIKTAISGRPGPVVIGLPEDMLADRAEVTIGSPAPRLSPHADPAALSSVRAALAGAKNPLAIVGGTGWSREACSQFADFAGRHQLPVAAAFRRQDIFDHRHPAYAGELGTGPNPALLEAVREADLLLVVGARLDEITTQGYTVPSPVGGAATIVHIHPSADELGKVYVPTLAALSDIDEAVAVLHGFTATNSADRDRWRARLNDAYQAWSAIDVARLPAWDGADMTAIFAWLRDALPPDAIVTTDAGNFSGWAQRYLRYGGPGRLLAPISGAMGYAIPAAIGAKLMRPARLVLGLCGDGGFLMNGQEIATAMHHGAAPVIMVCNNGMYGTIRMHQMRDFPGRVSATTLTNPDFAALARSYGANGIVVEKAADFPAAWESAVESKVLSVIEIRMDPRQLTTRSVLS